jgi:hypothetical protein
MAVVLNVVYAAKRYTCFRLVILAFTVRRSEAISET